MTRRRQLSPRRLAAPAFVTAAVLLGGASAGGLLANLALLLLALCVLAYSVWSPGPRAAPVPAERRLFWIGAAFLAVVLIQLIPLPPGVWSALPGREPVARGFALVGAPLPWLPISLDPMRTVTSALPLVLALAAIQSVRMSEDKDLTLLVWAIPGIAAVSILLGIAQLTSGANSRLYLYEITNRDQPVGFFANSNHLATLLVLSLPFVAALARGRLGRLEPHQRVPQIVAMCAIGLFLLMGAVIAGSVAGLALLVPSLLGSFLILRGAGRSPWAIAGFVGSLLAFALFIVIAAHSPLLSGFGITFVGDGAGGRPVFYANTIRAAGQFLPFGSGLGTFVNVYPWFEDAAKLDETFVNHAHCDYLEWVLELGIPGVLLLIAFFAWWFRRAFQIWLGRDQAPLAKAATIASGIVIAHSVVDYPIRTGAILVIFAMCLALMARPSSPPAAAAKAKARPRHLSVA